jgi:hypothetical protein
MAQVGVQVFTATNMKMTVFWGVEACSLVDNDRHFRGTYCLSSRRLMAVSSSQTSASIYRTTQGNISEQNHLHVQPKVTISFFPFLVKTQRFGSSLCFRHQVKSMKPALLCKLDGTNLLNFIKDLLKDRYRINYIIKSQYCITSFYHKTIEI